MSKTGLQQAIDKDEIERAMASCLNNEYTLVVKPIGINEDMVFDCSKYFTVRKQIAMAYFEHSPSAEQKEYLVKYFSEINYKISQYLNIVTL